METEARGLMLRVTWEWIGFDAALDVANTVAISDGVAHDLLAPEGEYERWAHAAAASTEVDADESTLIASRSKVLDLREHIRAALMATARGEPVPRGAAAALNRASRAAPTWLELDAAGEARECARGGAVDRVLAEYARSAIRIAAEGAARLRVCPAPSCGMLYRPTRGGQRWCSQQCGTRARFARHYRAKRGA